MTKIVLLRRKKLGKTSCEGIAQFAKSKIEVVRNDLGIPDADIYIRWGCTSTVPHTPGRKIWNQKSAIHIVGNKAGFRAILNEHALCPSTWFDWKDVLPQEFPVVVRPQVHAQGKQVYFCEGPVQMFTAVDKCGPGYYISQFINKVKEYRVFVVQGRAVWVANKVPGNPDDVAWNVAQGGKFENVRWHEWPLKVVKVSIQAFKLSGLDFGGVDVMVDAHGNCYVLEINSAPSQTSSYRQECTAKAFDYMIKNGTQVIDLIEQPGGYLKFIHPAIEESALV